MPNNDYISNILEIKDLFITNIDYTSKENHIYFTLKRKDCVCPHCKAITNKVHDYRTSIIKDSPIMGKSTLLHYRKRRYHCDSCNRHFTEPFSLLPKNCRLTTRLCFEAIHLLKSSLNVSNVASQLGISVSSIFRRLRDIKHQKPKTLPLVLSIDEFKGNSGGNKYHSILTVPKEHKVFDILPSRTQYRLEEYLRDFSNRKDVRYFVMDMYKVYKDIAQRLLPNATIVIDKFHVVKQVTGATERVRIRIKKQMHPSKRKYFKRSRKLILAHKDKLNKENLEALEVMLQQSNDLAQAYYLKELFYDFMDSKSSSEAKPKLRKFINAVSVSELAEFNSVLTTLANWAKYILNSFDCPYTNGYTEGMNNKIKVIKRNAYGYRNFENFRNRIMLSCDTI
ncbi:ISL3 family transposase [uncultured Eubacterium sp.]|jgi:transposase, IS204/IS1001/IS1096/IS1165 family protein|uniref:ISL3 family transposase n=1 Tax=uncultured Eubacterium sp. TaxID=165185 RepID=UPI0026177F72|nr:ISL3 family transposase [uncultured Eubacterium sp.]